MGDFIGSLLIGVISFGLYFTPALLATWRRHPRVVFIWLINVFLGWTVLGWIIALIWTLHPPQGYVKREPNKQGVMIAGGILLAICVLSALVPKTKSTGDATKVVAEKPEKRTAESEAATVAASDIPEMPTAPVEVSGNWTYQESEDKMRGTKTRFASVTSDNSQSFSFPYKGGAADLSVRRTGKSLDVYLEIEGQFTCSSYSDDTVAVKFDDGPVTHYKCASAADGSSNILFIRNEAGFLAKVKKAKHVVIEAEFFQEGRRQMEFTVAGLDFQ